VSEELVLTRNAVAIRLLGTVPLASLRAETRRNREWAVVYRGFRADSLTRALYARGALAFASDAARLRSLCKVFLESIGGKQETDLSEGFATAAQLESLDPDTRALCERLATTDVMSLPVQ
jgi:hypothetical protein